MVRKTSLAIILIGIFVLCACQASGITLGNTEPTATLGPTPTATLPPEQQAIWEAWEGSAHADTYALEKGPNTYCAQCHSPRNWNYEASIDPPPNCVSCKFSFEAEPRVAEHNPLVPEAEWLNIGCEICHRVDGRVADPQVVWYDNATGFYETVNSTTALCERCHQDKAPFLHHARPLGDQSHQGFTCTQCHDPHDPIASCADRGCHDEIAAKRRLPAQPHVNLTQREQCLECHTQGMEFHDMETQRTGETNCLVCHDYLANLSPEDMPPVYHSAAHKIVNCVACHDASGLEVQPVEGQNEWMPFRTLDLPFGESSEPYQSHNLSTGVDCTKCHHRDNPWGLPESVTAAR